MKTGRQLQQDIDEHHKRQRLLERVQRLVDKWQPILGVRINEIHVRRMNSYWASINQGHSRMWVCQDLANVSNALLEFVVVHELVHMRTDGHDPDFYALMDQHLPGWRKKHAAFAGPMTRRS